jgi:hypothetical protein
MHRFVRIPTLLAVLALACLGPRVAAASLRPSAGEQLVAQASTVADEFRQAVADDRSEAAENLRTFLPSDADVRVYHRDHRLLMVIDTNRNLPLLDKVSGERAAAAIARKVLEEKFRHVLQGTGDFRPLGGDDVRVVFMEPRAHEPCGGARLGGGAGRWGGGAGGPGTGGGACGSCPGAAGGFSSAHGSAGFGGNSWIGGGGPVPFAPYGIWSANTPTFTACTGCQ